MLILQRFLTECQVVQNIIRRQRVFWRVLALLAVCGVVECKCSFYGDLLQSAKYLEILFDANEFSGKYWLFFAYVAYGSANAYSKGIHYKVPSSWKYYSMPTSFLASIGVSSRLRRMGVQMLILKRFITKCQVVGNIFRRQRVFWRIMALLGLCSILECKCLLYGDFLPSAN